MTQMFVFLNFDESAKLERPQNAEAKKTFPTRKTRVFSFKEKLNDPRV